MRRFYEAWKKEILLLLRDPAGLGILFVLPGVMVFLITLIQDSALSAQRETRQQILVCDLDRDTLGQQLRRGFDASGFLEPIYTLNNAELSESDVYRLTSDGSYKMGMIIPKGVSEQIRTNAGNVLASVLGTAKKPGADTVRKTIQLVFDPAVPSSYKASVEIAMERNINAIQTGLLVDAFSARIAEFIPGAGRVQISADVTGVDFSTEYSTGENSLIKPNSVQHNVPAWTIFAMFFIVIPLGTSIVREKDNGIERRLRVIPGSFDLSVFGKISAYILICMLQFALMLSTGLVWLPMLGLPVLVIGHNVLTLLIVALTCALAATAYGLFIGTLARTHEQAASFGSISVLIMAAVGGIWVPSFVMPPVVKTLGSLSPLNWALNAFYDVFLREADLALVWPQLLKLTLFALVLLLAARFAAAFKYR
ncbi:MAG: ABC transporter permease [Bacteroidia bacterium]|nr:ABC transporter permease [Bacteroidia bacterium]